MTNIIQNTTFNEVAVATEYPVLENGEYTAKWVSSKYSHAKSGNLMVQLYFQVDTGDNTIGISDFLIVGGNNRNGQPNLHGSLGKIKALFEALNITDFYNKLNKPLAIFGEFDGMNTVVRELLDIIPAGHQYYDGRIILKIAKEPNMNGDGFRNTVKLVKHFPIFEELLADGDNVPF